MKLLFATSALAIAFAAAPAFAQVTSAQPPEEAAQPAETTQAPATAGATAGELTVQGVQPSKVLGAVDTEKLVDDAAEAKVESTATAEVQPPEDAAETRTADADDADEADTQTADAEEADTQTADAEAEATVDASSVATASAAVGTQTATLDPDAPIAAEVQAVVEKGNYTTADIVLAQLEAVRNSPVIEPTTVTTTVTTPAPTE